MLNPDHLPPTADQQLGSPVFSFEEGWLAGVGLGLLLIMATLGWRARRIRRRGTDD
jgi:hypothetical protein